MAKRKLFDLETCVIHKMFTEIFLCFVYQVKQQFETQR